MVSSFSDRAWEKIGRSVLGERFSDNISREIDLG